MDALYRKRTTWQMSESRPLSKVFQETIKPAMGVGARCPCSCMESREWNGPRMPRFQEDSDAYAFAALGPAPCTRFGRAEKE